MEATLIHNTATRKSLEMLFPAPLLDKAFQTAIASIAPKVKIPGFRPGKAPKSVLMKKFQNEVAREVAENLMDSHFTEAINRIGIQPISRPAIEKAELREGAEGKVTIQFDVAPEVKLPEYKGAKLTKKKHRIDDSFINENLELMRERAARLVPVEEGAAMGHYVVLDIRVKPQGMKTKFYEAEQVQLAEGRPFDTEILGMKVDEDKKFTLQIPEDDQNRTIAGKQVHYEVFVIDIRARAVPELNDEFAKDAGNFENLQALKDNLRRELEESAERDAIARLQGDVLDQLLVAAPFDVPGSMVNLQLDDYCREFADRLAQQGISHKRINWRAFRQRRLVDAERAVRSGYLLQALGNAEDIQVSYEEIDQEIRKWMEESKSGDSFETIKADFEKHGATTEIRGRVRTEKIFDMLIKNATVTEELLGTAAYRDLLEVERRREEGIAQARFNAGGLEGGDFEEQEGGGPEAIKSAEETTEEVTPTETETGEAPLEFTPPKRGRTRKAESAEETAEAEEVAEAVDSATESAPAKRGRPKKADPAPVEALEEEVKPKRGRPKKTEG